MAKKNAFDIFREATLSDNSDKLKNAVEYGASGIPKPAPEKEKIVKTRTRTSKNEGRELVSFHLDSELKRSLGFVKFNTGKSYNELYVEAVADLIEKYK